MTDVDGRTLPGGMERRRNRAVRGGVTRRIEAETRANHPGNTAPYHRPPPGRPMSDADPINHPPHYTSSPATCPCGDSIECIQVTEWHNFCIGNAIKYLWRAGLKGDAVEDLRKSIWYIEREIQRLGAAR